MEYLSLVSIGLNVLIIPIVVGTIHYHIDKVKLLEERLHNMQIDYMNKAETEQYVDKAIKAKWDLIEYIVKEIKADIKELVAKTDQIKH